MSSAIERARAAYVRGDIDLDTFGERIDIALRNPDAPVRGLSPAPRWLVEDFQRALGVPVAAAPPVYLAEGLTDMQAAEAYAAERLGVARWPA